MTANEELPQLICNECALHLNVAYKFKKKVIHAEKLFLDALTENEDRKRVPPLTQLPIANGGSGNDEDMLESHVEVEQKVIPGEQEMQVDEPPASEEEEPQEPKYVQANLMQFFNTNELIELSDTDSDSTVDEVELVQQRTGELE